MISIIPQTQPASQQEPWDLQTFQKRNAASPACIRKLTFNMKKFFKFIFFTVIIISIGWVSLTIIAERTGPEKSWTYGQEQSATKVIVVYDPDPFFNLDERVCRSFGQTLGEQGMQASVVSVAVAREIQLSSYDVYVFCANTYNWGPDLAVTNFIKEQKTLDNKPVVAIILGAGATSLSQERLEQIIVDHGGKIIDSRAVWLMRPNDESRLKESNVQVAVSKVRAWAISIAEELDPIN
jgi:hypothetical protein